MKYTELQRRLKQYQIADLVKVKLNSSKSVLEAEYQRCLQLKLSQNYLKKLAVIKNYGCLEIISAQKNIFYLDESIPTLQAKAYNLDRVEALEELKLAFPTKVSWVQCVYSIDRSAKNSQEFNKFKLDVEAFITAIKEGKYYQLTGDAAVEEAYEDLSNYISWWKGAQWEFTKATKASTLDLLKRAWLEQYLSEHNLDRLLKYSPID